MLDDSPIVAATLEYHVGEQFEVRGVATSDEARELLEWSDIVIIDAILENEEFTHIDELLNCGKPAIVHSSLPQERIACSQEATFIRKDDDDALFVWLESHAQDTP